MKRIKKISIWVAVAPLVLLFGILSLPIVLVMETRGALSLRAFRRREAGHVYLICTSKRNWHDFLKNNVIPILPDNFRVVWQKSRRGGQYPDLVVHLARSRVFGVSKPYMVVVTRKALRHQSLNVPLQQLKAHAKRSDDIRKACAGIIKTIEEELRTSGPTVRATARP
jgi:hypothetical protein